MTLFYFRQLRSLSCLSSALALSASVLASDKPTGTGPVSEALQTPPTIVQYPETKDKLRPINKTIFAFNHAVNRFAIAPLGKAYRKAIPKPVRTSLGNVFDTVQEPLSSVHHIVQGRGKLSLQNLERFAINITLGLGGILDPATKTFAIPKSDTGLDKTLQNAGLGRGAYLVVPFLGSSDCRAFIGTIGDSVLNPLSLLETPLSTRLKLVDAFQENAPMAENYMELYNETADPYRFLRNLYQQGRLRDEDYPARLKP